MIENVNLIISPEGIKQLIRALTLLEKGALPEVTIEAPEQNPRVRIMKGISGVEPKLK